LYTIQYYILKYTVVYTIVPVYTSFLYYSILQHIYRSMLHTILYYSTNLYYTTVYIIVYTILNTIVYYVLYGTVVLICIMQYFYTEIRTNTAEIVLGPPIAFDVFCSKIIYKSPFWIA